MTRTEMESLVSRHLEAQWQRHFVETGYSGPITKAIYFARNAPHVRRNIRNGIIPDGKGGYTVR